MNAQETTQVEKVIKLGKGQLLLGGLGTSGLVGMLMWISQNVANPDDFKPLIEQINKNAEAIVRIQKDMRDDRAQMTNRLDRKFDSLSMKIDALLIQFSKSGSQ